MKRMRPKRFSAPLLPAALLAAATFLLAGCEPPGSTRPADTAHASGNDQGPVSVPVPLPEPPPIVITDLAPEDRAPLTGPSNAPLPAEGDTLTAGQVLDRLRARLSQPTCIVGPNNTRWRHKYAGYPRHFADEIVATLPRMLVVLDELETHKLPAEFAMIPIVESWYRQDVHSFGGAAGMWQLIAETARNNGATVNGNYDGRLSMLDSTDAAMNYLDKLQGMFHDWRLTAMAYNSGEYRLAKTMSPGELAARSSGSAINYRRPFGLAFGTYEYVSKMRALVCMLAQPQRQEIPFDTTVPITHWVRYTVPADIGSLDELAQRLGTDAEELKAFNHGYHSGRIGDDAPRTLLVPASTRSRWANASVPKPPAPAATSAMPAGGATAPTATPATKGASAPVTIVEPPPVFAPPTPAAGTFHAPAPALPGATSSAPASGTSGNPVPASAPGTSTQSVHAAGTQASGNATTADTTPAHAPAVAQPVQPPSTTTTPAGKVQTAPAASTGSPANGPESSKPTTTSGSPAPVLKNPAASPVPLSTTATTRPAGNPPASLSTPLPSVPSPGAPQGQAATAHDTPATAIAPATAASTATATGTKPLTPPAPMAPAKQPDSTPPAMSQPVSPPRPPPAAVSPTPSSTQATAATAPAAVEATIPVAPHAPRTYKVEMDDSLASIAQRFGVKVEDLRTWNHLGIDATLYVDEVLKLEP